MFLYQNKSEIRPNSHRTQPHVNIRKTNDKQTDPCEKHVPFVQCADAAVGFFADGFVGQNVPRTADEVAEAVAAQSVKAETKYICGQHDRADADAEMLFAVRSGEPHRVPRVVSQKEQEHDCEYKGNSDGRSAK